MILQGQVGPTVNSDGVFANTRQGRGGEIICAESNPRYYENTYRGQTFSITFASAALAASSTTAVGSFFLYNPPGSGKNLVMIDFVPGFTITTAQTQSTEIMLGGWVSPALSALSAAVTPNNTFIGNGNSSVAKGYTSGTATGAANPLAIRNVGNVIADLTASDIQLAKDEIAGAVIVAPGCGINLYGITAGTVADVSLAPTFTWAEVNI